MTKTALARAAILAIAGYRGYVEAIPGTSASLVRGTYGLDEHSLARLMGWIAVASLGAVGIGRLFDRYGRRPVLLACVAAIPVLSLASALAPTLSFYLAAQVGVFALVGAIFAGTSVLIAETIPGDQRAAALGHVGLLDAIGGGGAILFMPLAAQLPGSWRWLWLLALLPMLGFGRLRRALPEADRWEAARAAGETGQSSLRLVVSAAYRGRALALTGSFLLIQISFGALLFWPYYHAVQAGGLSLGEASAMVLIGGGIGLGGFFAGGRLADKLGRGPTVALGSLLSVAAGTLFYTTTSESGWWILAGGYTCFVASNAASAVASQAAGLELFPTPVRGTVATWLMFMTALGVVIAQFLVAALSGWAGGLHLAVAWVGAAALPGALWFWLGLPETRGLTLEEASSGQQS